MNALVLTISDIAIRQDEGRFCLNDLHKASGNQNKHRPSLWLKNQQTIDLIGELSEAGISALEQNQAVKVVHGGNRQGTYVVKELVYAYAMWISPKFHLQVIRTFDALVMHQPIITDAQLQTLADRLKPLLRQPAFGTPRKWTPVDDQILLTLKAEGLGATRIGYRMGRSSDSIKHRYNRIKAQGGAQ